ncbi:MAG: transcriptional regulator NrdR [Pseudomonadota bacterium]
MKCPFCPNLDTQVKDSRPGEDGLTIRRRRFCPACNSRFTTFERVQLRDLYVKKKNGEIRAFDRDKITRAISIAVRKRPFNSEDIDNIVNSIVQKLESGGESEVPSSLIGEMVMDELKNLDEVAYIRFASVYRNFREARDFEKFVDELE